MTLPPIIEAQKIMALVLRDIENADKDAAGYALHVAEEFHNAGLEIKWRQIGDDSGLRQDTTPARAADEHTTANASDKEKT